MILDGIIRIAHDPQDQQAQRSPAGHTAEELDSIGCVAERGPLLALSHHRLPLELFHGLETWQMLGINPFRAFQSRPTE
jgi:hypothetical protein